MLRTRKHARYLQNSCLLLIVVLVTGCAVIEAIFQGLSDFQRDVNALQSRPQALIGDFSPRGISVYLSAWPQVDTAEEFLQWLPREFKDDWIMMTRSESLQTGTPSSPRIILSNGNSGSNRYKYVFALTLKADPNFPLAHPNVIEYMQYDDMTKKFRFHEIDLRNSAPALRVSTDNAKCLHCHGGSRENLRPNWDAYDSWGGMMPFNRDRIYEGSVEEAALKRILNTTLSPDLAPIVRQLSLPEGVTRAGDGSISISYSPQATSRIRNSYAFDGRPVSSSPPVPPNGSEVIQGGRFLTIDQATGSSTPDDGSSDQGRGVELFDELTTHNAQRVKQELIDYSTRGPIDVRPIAAAIARSNEPICQRIRPQDQGTILTADQRMFFETRHTMTPPLIMFNDLLLDTQRRRQSLPQRKADLQRFNLDGMNGLIGTYGPTPADTTIERIRQEVFQRPLGRSPIDSFQLDVVTRLMVDRELYANDEKIALFRFFLEPLGIAVDKWSMSVRGRSRTYTFADSGPFGKYISTIQSLGSASCAQLIADSQAQLARLGPLMARSTPTPAEVQNILNRNCTECHSSFGYPPAFPSGSLVDFTEGTGYANAQTRARSGALMSRITINPVSGASSMPLGGPPLSQTDIATLQRWAAAGAP